MNACLRTVQTLAAAGAAALLAGCWERPPIDSVQHGYRGTGMVQVFNPRITAAQDAVHQAPESIPRVAPDGPLAKDVYKNVKVLGNLDVANFTRLMAAMTQWVSPEQGCNYCHKDGNFEDETLYTKHVSRRMLEMTQHVNSTWKSHVGDTGVTCYTCHRGKPVPDGIWFANPAVQLASDKGAGWNYGQNMPARQVGLSSLPADPFTPFLLDKGQIRVHASQALPSGHKASIQHTEWTYALMMHMSEALRVNCTYCHNSRHFAGWDGVPPQRASAWYGIRMVRDLNVAYLDPLKPTYPAERLGPAGDAPKANCTTCHQGAFKPLYGAAMAREYPELLAAVAAPAAAVAPAPAGTLGRVLFDVGRKDLSAEAVRLIGDTAQALKANPGVKVSLSGFADRTGNADANLELAKQRAFAVRDALKAAGVAEDRIELKKPEFVIGDASADSRRVDINVAN
jgi:photosynthetic reaction center cytochrome c subunit